MIRLIAKDGSFFSVHPQDAERVRAEWESYVARGQNGIVNARLSQGGDLLILRSEIQSMTFQSDEQLDAAWRHEAEMDNRMATIYKEEDWK